MNRTVLNLETVTPMFLHGENSRNLELRPPPFKSLMRYWWRTVQDCEWKSLQKDEAKLFGSTDRKAPFSIRIPGTQNLATGSYKPLPHKQKPIFNAYKADRPFALYLITKNGSNASTYEQIAKLGFLLGGVGNRSRRGFGSIRETSWNFTDVSNLRKEVLDILNAVAGTERFQMKGQIIESKLTRFPNYPVIMSIYFGNPTRDVDSLLRKIGWATHNHKDNALGSATPRMASPIHVRIQKMEGKYVPIVTQLYYPGNKSNNFEQKQKDFINAIIT